VKDQLSVREVEEAVRARSGSDEPTIIPDPASPSPTAGPGRVRPPGLLELEELLSDRLSTRVKVSMGAKKGRVVIDFASIEDLERIYRAMSEPPT
jgi:ParB family chromosome partitioning protein